MLLFYVYSIHTFPFFVSTTTNLPTQANQQCFFSVVFHTWWDFSSTTAMAKSVCDSASKTPGYAIKVREFAKFAKYNAECKRQGVAFLPLVMEVHGTMSRTVHSAAEMLAEYGATSGAPSPPSKHCRTS